MLLVGLTVLGALALYSVRRTALRAGEVVVHERLERHRAVLDRVGLERFEQAIDRRYGAGG